MTKVLSLLRLEKHIKCHIIKLENTNGIFELSFLIYLKIR